MKAILTILTSGFFMASLILGFLYFQSHKQLRSWYPVADYLKASDPQDALTSIKEMVNAISVFHPDFDPSQDSEHAHDFLSKKQQRLHQIEKQVESWKNAASHMSDDQSMITSPEQLRNRIGSLKGEIADLAQGEQKIVEQYQGGRRELHRVDEMLQETIEHLQKRSKNIQYILQGRSDSENNRIQILPARTPP